jgi:DNA invertase Pin-like site-specific DNA recombinase
MDWTATTTTAAQPAGTAPTANSKVAARHLTRAAVLYVRQSTPRQVLENQESTRRQYALRERALALGWQADQVQTIDTDLGQSGASAADRAGFQHLVGEVALGKVGIVLGLEVSRLARNSSDWHRLLELCALGDTLILDEDGLYDPSHFNDRLLLGLKGTMSEAELHMLRARLRGGLLAKAARGELRIPLPVGLCYDPAGRVVLHPDVQVQAAVRLFFETFARVGSACATVKHFSQRGLKFPTAARVGPAGHDVVWGRLSLPRAVIMLHSPRYAGAYAFGRQRHRKRPGGGTRAERLPRDQWHALLPDAHPGYVSWDQYERNQHTMAASAHRFGQEKRTTWTPREGPALLQGLAVCGKCGRNLMTRYHHRNGRAVPDYVCLLGTAEYRELPCQAVPGAGVDAAVRQMALDAVTPMALDVAFAVQAELQARDDDAERLRCRQVERAEYEVDLARRRYMAVDPGNRLVAATLEADWNARMRDLERTRADAGRQRQADRSRLDDATRQRILALCHDFPAVWNDPRTPDRERKRMVALLIEDVTLTRREQIAVQVRFRGGKTCEFDLPVPLNAWRRRQTHPGAVAILRGCDNGLAASEIAARLNAAGYTTGAGAQWSANAVHNARRRHQPEAVRTRRYPDGRLACTEIARALGLSPTSVKNWRNSGRLLATRPTQHGAWAYLPIDQQPQPARHLAARQATIRASLAPSVDSPS